MDTTEWKYILVFFAYKNAKSKSNRKIKNLEIKIRQLEKYEKIIIQLEKIK